MLFRSSVVSVIVLMIGIACARPFLNDQKGDRLEITSLFSAKDDPEDSTTKVRFSLNTVGIFGGTGCGADVTKEEYHTEWIPCDDPDYSWRFPPGQFKSMKSFQIDVRRTRKDGTFIAARHEFREPKTLGCKPSEFLFKPMCDWNKTPSLIKPLAV